ncbi:hypothetical protein CANCADRAFT_31307 [Tortispora caseinolytica NRRL Y-17796]|uniref:Uncharacterized protein n=1 Tax=Tortispora caseinolytica NRRL Y-17796 TaxID=767744 RepID=A0A1E4TEZ6_9ASCO|nr:hypothetical protein CANCADRAFT_31307 [Tortispora caseinolytica NRRL Y-17796]
MSSRSSSSQLIDPSAVAGLSAGVVTTLIVHPLDLIKVRLQVLSQTAYPSYSVIYRTATKNGFFKGLYRGVGLNITGNALSWALYFSTYDRLKTISADRDPTGRYFLSSGLAGLLVSFITSPIWVLKTRVLATMPGATGYASIAQTAANLYNTEGITGFWRGYLTSIFGVAQAALQFTVYEHIRAYRTASKTDNLSTLDILTMSALAKIISSSIAYPYQVVRARVQYETSHPSSPQGRYARTISNVYRESGIRGFYRGIGPNILRVLPATCITFAVYENTISYLTT